MLLLDKLLPIVVYPLGLAILGLIASVLVGRRWPRRAAVAAAGLLWIASMPAVAVALTGFLALPPVWPATGETRDVIIVLGGMIAEPARDGRAPHLGEAGDRLVTALELYRHGAAPRILISGGNVPWSDNSRPEAEEAADLLVLMGVPRSALLIEGASRNTRENALNSAALMQAEGLRHAWLVTGAVHMPRALAAFRTAGVDAVPIPAHDGSAEPSGSLVLDMLPSASALADITAMFREVIGRTIYRLRGWA